MPVLLTLSLILIGFHIMHTVRIKLFVLQAAACAGEKKLGCLQGRTPVIITGSMADQTCMEVSLKIVKILAYILSFLFVLGGAVVSKGTLLFMTSQLSSTRSIPFCSEVFNGNYKYLLPLSYF